MLKIRTYLHLNDKAALLQQAKKISTRHLQPHHDPQSSHGEVKTSESFGDTSIDVVWGSDPEVPTLHQDNSWLPDYSGIRTMSPSAQLDALDLPSAFSEEVMSGRTERSEHHGVLRAEAGAFVMSPLHELDAQDLSPMPFEEMRIYDGKADKNYSPSTNSDVIKISVEPPSRSESLSSADDHKYFPMMLMSPDTGSLDPSSNIPPPEPSILETGSKIQCCICHDSPFPSYWACIECSDDESEYLICDNCEDAQYLACHLCAETFVQPSWYFGCHGDDQFLCGACTKLGRSSALPIGSDRHVYTHALVRRPCLLQPPVDLTCKPLHSADPLWVVQDHVTEIRQDVQVIKDRMEQVHVAVGTTGDSSVAHSRAYHAAVETRVAAVERRVELIDNRLELVQIQTDRITEYLERLLSESKDRPAFVVSPILQEQPGRSDES
ncbi:hypothetical protein CERSUDRAFT_125184 [Gelatoporia subvermispora B]|uniref:Uncharacterized protein n=1 Tax=Ceriporiopsis subvermispora (strain B) TaxID=914234 RepID=M2QQX5_CERS8|nr:hypothetical protein CERSUDRAFT_125184 [Gelatoporia subvermispora B]